MMTHNVDARGESDFSMFFNIIATFFFFLTVAKYKASMSINNTSRD